ncbi:hypothetical protein FRC00_012236 [Tulasnella sp. 408]|nr:hypothetical protein FRC00_012236 [Tulasnella sp. 408]
MTTEKQIPTPADDSERLRKYRLTPDELRDESKLRAKIISSKAVFSYGALGANAAGIPGLGAVFVALEGVVNSVDRVQRQRKRCKFLENSWTNLVNVVHVNREFMEEQLLVDIMDAAVEYVYSHVDAMSALEDFKKYLGEWSKMGWFESWWKRHPIAEKVDEFHQAFEEAYRLVPGLQQAIDSNAIANQRRIESEIYRIRMDQTLDVSDLPAYLGGEVTLLDPKVGTGNRYEIALGRWLGREIVALKFPMDFEVLDSISAPDGSMAGSGSPERVEITRLVQNKRRYVGLSRKRSRNLPALMVQNSHLVTPWLESGSVRKFIDWNGPSSLERLRLVRDIVNGLIYIHGKDVVHGSLSPTNVLVKTDGSTPTALIGDFSVAKIVQANDRLAVTDLRDDRAMARYQAREVYTMGEAITPEADVFAWATTSLEVLSGVRPYDKEDEPQALFDRVLTRRMGPTIEEHKSPIWESCPGLWDLLVACWNEVPRLRPRLNDILTKLNGYVQHHETGP